MHPDREALIAGIAADPGNDLRRLVFADWLEENGEPERAEFIRLQVEAATETDSERRRACFNRALELIQAFGPVWLDPFLSALDPKRDAATEYYYAPSIFGDPTNFSLSAPSEYKRLSPVAGVAVERGFASTLWLNLCPDVKSGSVGIALQNEPLSALTVYPSPDGRDWEQFSEPALRNILHLELTGGSWGRLSSVGPPVFADPHLAGVRSLKLRSSYSDESFVPAATLATFVQSPLAYRLSALSATLDDLGLRAVCRSERLVLDRFAATRGEAAPLDPVGVRSLVAAPFARALRALSLQFFLDDAALGILARGERFAKLNELDLSGNRFSDAGLRALAAARFLPQLEVLDISGCELGDPDSAPGLRALADALNPDRLKRFRLASCGFADAPPAFLVERFGDRVEV